MNIIIVDIKAQHRYRTILVGIRYDIGRCDALGDFRRNMGRWEPYEPDVSRELFSGEDG